MTAHIFQLDMLDNGAAGSHAIASVIDMSEHNKIEAALNETNAKLEERIHERTKQLEAASLAKSDFLASMSHELRTPLNAIIGFSELLKDGVVGTLHPKQFDFCNDIYEASQHLLSLINDILDLSKVEAGKCEIQIEEVNLLKLFQSSIRMVQEKAFTRNIQIRTSFDPSLGFAHADQRKLKQIVYNLLSNAVNFTPDSGQVSLRASRCKRADIPTHASMPVRFWGHLASDTNEFLQILVEDTGVGISQTNMQRLFEPFVQINSSASTRESGTGLGLSLVRRFAELFEGMVGVSSHVGVGSTFYVWLPYREVGQIPETAPQVAAIQTLAEVVCSV